MAKYKDRFDSSTEALADAWASIDGRMRLFRRCKSDRKLEDVEGRYEGYMADAGELKRRLARRGFIIIKPPKEQCDD